MGRQLRPMMEQPECLAVACSAEADTRPERCYSLRQLLWEFKAMTLP